MFEEYLKELEEELKKLGVASPASVVEEYRKKFLNLREKGQSDFEILVLLGDAPDVARSVVKGRKESAEETLEHNFMLLQQKNKQEWKENGVPEQAPSPLEEKSKKSAGAQKQPAAKKIAADGAKQAAAQNAASPKTTAAKQPAAKKLAVDGAKQAAPQKAASPKTAAAKQPTAPKQMAAEKSTAAKKAAPISIDSSLPAEKLDKPAAAFSAQSENQNAEKEKISAVIEKEPQPLKKEESASAVESGKKEGLPAEKAEKFSPLWDGVYVILSAIAIVFANILIAGVALLLLSAGLYFMVQSFLLFQEPAFQTMGFFLALIGAALGAGMGFAAYKMLRYTCRAVKEYCEKLKKGNKQK